MGIVKFQTRPSEREYKDEEKKVIKNEKCYCILILFYIPTNIRMASSRNSNPLTINVIEKAIMLKRLITTQLTILNFSKYINRVIPWSNAVRTPKS